ncbi:hypothetical protein [Pseudogemmobacter blasticus]|uniref:Mu-like prophage FluMu N-terminal domain-containing protein n=1 Tax=Fuscovulum blasticum DSM 2131 TaxID=1188250 RepID=A0A2T4JDP0_FUSBL|nr:hypothetical protein [Fuscovulum blasticum]PTE15938.1 hypothetical protein C5F44_02555 [Fuscovulum blasticum DSM 2131]
MKRLIIKATAAAGFFRCGVHWPEAGKTVSRDEFTPEQWTILKDEPNLRIGPAPEDTVDVAGAIEDSLRVSVRDAIGQLEPGDFGEDGLPKVEALRKALPTGTKGLTKALVAEIWAELKPAV